METHQQSSISLAVGGVTSASFLSGQVKGFDLSTSRPYAQELQGLFSEASFTIQRKYIDGKKSFGTQYPEDDEVAIQQLRKFSQQILELIPQLLSKLWDDQSAVDLDTVQDLIKLEPNNILNILDRCERLVATAVNPRSSVLSIASEPITPSERKASDDSMATTLIIPSDNESTRMASSTNAAGPVENHRKAELRSRLTSMLTPGKRESKHPQVITTKPLDKISHLGSLPNISLSNFSVSFNPATPDHSLPIALHNQPDLILAEQSEVVRPALPRLQGEKGGFCEGAWRLHHNRDLTALSAQARYTGIYTMGWFWTCTAKKCYFDGLVYGTEKKKTFDSRVRCLGNVRYKWLFLAKSHLQRTSRSGDVSQEYKCLFCFHLGGDGMIYRSGDDLVRHIDEVHQSYLPDPSVLWNMRCIAGRIASAEDDFDINITPRRDSQNDVAFVPA